MELKMNDYQLPEAVSFNYEELKKELAEKVSHYETLVYTDDQIKLAKEDRANLNKLKKALNDERIRLEKEYMIPFNTFKAQINEIIGIIDKPVAVIDSQVKAYEEKQKQDKRKKINEYFEERYLNSGTPSPDCFTLERIFDEKWLNASVSMKSIQSEIDARAEQIKNDLDTLSNLPEFGFEATEVYKSTLDINKALNEGKRLSEIAKAKATHEAELKAKAEEEARLAESKKQAEQVAEQTGEAVFNNAPDVSSQILKAPEKQWIAFQALLSTEDALALKQFFNDRQIEFKAV